ncbi:MAG: hypothetical protein KGL31_01320 [candidate division NC10 bacterium]|nr:hypothetical protein [candidate division NC10 bacterium]MDE2320550.1 hypothetical protein [candidate division NC10 bacterium]
MTDPRSILDALQALKVATDIVKAFRSADASFEKAELKFKVAELADALANARLGVVEAQEEILAQKRRIAELETAQDLRDRIMHRENVYFVRDGETEKGPYCPRCFESEQKVMPLTALSGPFRTFASYTCPQCKAQY